VPDFYSEWLSIPESPRPPSPYDLLGITTSESNPVAVIAAAERQLACVREFQTGPHSAESQRIGAEISHARDAILETLAKKAVAEAAIPEAVYPTANDSQKANWWADWQGVIGESSSAEEASMALPHTETALPVVEILAEAIPGEAHLGEPNSAVHRDWRTEPPPGPGPEPIHSESALHVEPATPEAEAFFVDAADAASRGRRGSAARPVVLFLLSYVLPVTLFVVFAVQLWETQKVPAIVCMSGALFSTIFGVLQLLMTGRRH